MRNCLKLHLLFKGQSQQFQVQRLENARRLLYEDSIRNAYIATFPNDDYIKNLALELPVFDSSNVSTIIKNSWGNYKEIEAFLRENKRIQKKALDILKVIYEKDLRDTPQKKYFAKSFRCLSEN